MSPEWSSAIATVLTAVSTWYLGKKTNSSQQSTVLESAKVQVKIADKTEEVIHSSVAHVSDIKESIREMESKLLSRLNTQEQMIERLDLKIVSLARKSGVTWDNETTHVKEPKGKLK